MTSSDHAPSVSKRDRPLSRFVSIGECMVEMSPGAEQGAYRMGFAGDTFNTAWYMRALRPDIATRFVSRVGTDAVSEGMLDAMRGAGIDTAHIGRDADRTVGLYMISLDRGERSFSYWRDASAARRLAQDEQALARAIQDADLIYFSGITMAILDREGRATLLAELAAARAAGVTVAFDSNLRLRLWKNVDEMKATTMRAAEISDIVLPSYDDEATYFGDVDSAATIARYKSTGAATIVVKNGAGAVCYAHDGHTGTVAPPMVTKTVDTTAAGDSFNAGFLASFDAEDKSSAMIEAAICRASAVARQVICGAGALVPLDLDTLGV